MTDTIRIINDTTAVMARQAPAAMSDTARYIEDGTESISTALNHPHIHTLWFDFLWPSVLAGIIVGFLIVAIWKLSRYLPSQVRSISLKWPFIIVWIYGFLVYDIGMCPTGERIALFTNAPLAFLYAFKIFLLDSDVSEIQNRFHESWVFSFNFAMCHFLAAVISTLFIIKTFGFNAMAKLKLWFSSLPLFRKKVEETYVFWGFNDSAYRLIKSIRQHYEENPGLQNKGQSRNYRIIIVMKDQENDDSPEGKGAFSRIFDFFAMPSRELSKLQELKYLTTGTHVDIKNINPEKAIATSSAKPSASEA